MSHLTLDLSLEKTFTITNAMCWMGDLGGEMRSENLCVLYLPIPITFINFDKHLVPPIWKILNIQTRGGKLIKGLFGFYGNNL
jgi:hypothetical protein